jgi:hypothetical protein
MSANAATPSSEYQRRVTDVRKVRDFVRGNVRSYIERLVGHDDPNYVLYSRLAYYLPAVSRTLDAYVGMVMTPEPIISDSPEEFQTYLDDMTSDGEPFQRVCFRAVEEVVSTGRCFIMVDYPSDPDAEGLSVLDAERRGLRPFVRIYTWEDIIDLRVTTINGKRQLSHIRLMEYVDEPGISEWETKTRRYVRVLDLAEGAYRVRLYRETEQSDQIDSQGRLWRDTPSVIQVGSDMYPRMAGQPLGYIPGVVIGPSGLDPSIINKPPLLEMVEISRSHLNDSALRQWALLWCGQPTLILSGLADPEAGVVKLGSSEGILLGEEGSAQLLSLGADGVGAIKEAMEEKRRDMAAIGARILADESGAQVATETARIQRAGEHSVLAGIANSIADGMTQVLRMLAEWAGINAPDIAVTLNTDFMPRGLQQGELVEWLGRVQEGSMPLSVALEHLKARGVVDPQMTEQEWRDAIDETMIDRPPMIDE